MNLLLCMWRSCLRYVVLVYSFQCLLIVNAYVDNVLCYKGGLTQFGGQNTKKKSEKGDQTFPHHIECLSRHRKQEIFEKTTTKNFKAPPPTQCPTIDWSYWAALKILVVLQITRLLLHCLWIKEFLSKKSEKSRFR